MQPPAAMARLDTSNSNEQQQRQTPTSRTCHEGHQWRHVLHYMALTIQKPDETTMPWTSMVLSFSAVTPWPNCQLWKQQLADPLKFAQQREVCWSTLGARESALPIPSQLSEPGPKSVVESGSPSVASTCHES